MNPAESPTPLAPDASEDGLPRPRRQVAAAAVLTGIALVVLDGSVANVALPSIAQSLQVSPAASVWTVTSYQMALAMALLPCAAAGESLGFRRVFTAGVLLFLLASAFCALSPGLGWLVAARFVQGLGGAAVMAPIAALLRHTYPQHLLGMAIGWNALTVALSSAAGPAAGALILSVASWPWLFAINVPIGIAVLLAARALPSTATTARKPDVLSIALNGGVFAALIVGLDLIALRPLPGVALLGAAAVCLVALIRRELPREAPLVPLDLLRSRPFRISVIASVCCFAAQMLGYVALPFYLQHQLQLSALMTGLCLTPWPLMTAISAPLAGRGSDRIPTAWLCAAGGLCLALGLFLAALWPSDGPIAALVACTMICGLGFGCFQTPNNRNMLLAAPRQRSGAAGGMQSTARLVGQSTGAVTMALLFSLLPEDAAPRVGLAVAAVLALAGGLVSTLRIGR